MNLPRTAQEWVHWLEAGPGARWIRRCAIALAVVLLSLFAGYKQFRGLQSENVIAQAVTGRQIASGEGFTTRIRYPQTLAVLKEHGLPADPGKAWPELHQPPLYPLAIGAMLAVVPSDLREAIFRGTPSDTGGFPPDFVLLALNIGLLWLAAWLAAGLAGRLFGSSAGTIAALGLLLSAPVWLSTTAADGTPLMMVLLLGVFHGMVRAGEADAEGRRSWPWLALAGVFAGLLFLGDLPAGLVLLPLALHVALFNRGRARTVGLVALVIAFIAVIAPWLWRNTSLTGNPFGLAGQAVALKAGDPTAEPETVRTTFSAAGPVLDLAKLGNKGTTAIQSVVAGRLWSGGGIWFTALFATGLLYRFKTTGANRLRWLFVLTLAVLVCSHAFLGSGEEERQPAVYAVPLIAVFGTGFFLVLVASSDLLANRLFWAATGLLVLQALPLAHELAEPKRSPFSYPPYYPPFYAGIRIETAVRGGLPWMSDAPAGAAWYSDQAVWARPATVRDFRRIGTEHPVYLLLLTSRTLQRPPANRGNQALQLIEWGDVYGGIVAGRIPSAFPLPQIQRVTDELVLLMDPVMMRGRQK